MVKKDMSNPKKGMNRDTYPGELTKDEYSFALNANFHSENGNGRMILQNENSNVKCSGFKQGYVVVGYKYDLVSELTYFFLTNPNTGFSEIGVISSIPESFSLTPTETTDADGNIKVVLETPLEEQPQVGYCSYQTVLSDACGNKCLNFSVNDPFHENNIHIKYGKRGKTLWFTHKSNPQRYIQLDNLEIYTQDVDPCTDQTTETCLDCEKMRVFPLHEKPCLSIGKIVSGGNLKAGNYEVSLAYCDIFGTEITDYSPLTQPVRIHDKNNNILGQTLLDYITNQAFQVNIANLDMDFDFIKVAVVYSSGLDGAKTVYIDGVYPTSIETLTIYEVEGKEKSGLEVVLHRRPFYKSAKGSAVQNGYLYYYGLETQRTFNLQPVVNLMGAFAKWNTYMAKEKLYEDGTAMAKYGGYMRNEVYPFSIEFEIDGGQQTANFPLIARPPLQSEIEVINTVEVQSVNEYNPECFGNARTKRWQIENTATETGNCFLPQGEIDGDEIIETETRTCTVTTEGGQVEVVDSIASGSVVVPAGVLDLVQYINSHKQEIISSSGTNWEDVRDILDDPTDYPLAVCTPDFGDYCSDTYELVSEEMFASGVATQTPTQVDAPIDSDSYPPIPANQQACQIYQRDAYGDLNRDAVFEGDNMLAGEAVYKRIDPTNISCNLAIEPLEYSEPPLSSNYYLQNKGAVAPTSLQGTLTTDATYQKLTYKLTGTSGTINVIINGVPYLATFNTSINQTWTFFVSTHGPTIEGMTPSVSGDTLTLIGPATSNVFNSGFSSPSADMDGSFDHQVFTDKLHTNAIWFKVPFGTETKKIFQVGANLCTTPDDNNGSAIRISIYDGCPTSTNVTGAKIVQDIAVADINKVIELSVADFTNPTAYIAIDSPIRFRKEDMLATQLNTLTPPCGCFNAYKMNVRKGYQIDFTNLTFGKQQTYSSDCTYVIPKLGECEAVPYKKGNFGYWESTQKYPCNKELYDSSELKIYETDIPAQFRPEFESYYTNGQTNGYYNLKPETDFRDKPIRHYRFPDNTVAPFMSTRIQDPQDFNPSLIFPIGFNLSAQIIAAFLDIAVKNDLLTPEERQRITGYRIYRGDRRLHKSVIAKGLLFDMYKYVNVEPNKVTDIFYPNYPLNALGLDQLNGNVVHPHGSTANDFFTFHSPETDYFEPSLSRELYVEGYQFGKSASYFDQVQDYSKYVVLGDKAYDLANSLASTELALELLMQSSDWLTTAASGGLSAPAAIGLAATFVVTYTVGAIFKFGEYRYKWVETFRNLGQLENLAYYQATVGYYNSFEPNTVPFQKRRGLTVSSYLKDGMKTLANEFDHTDIKVNMLDREWTVALHLGSYELNYPNTYSNYDRTPNTGDGDSSRRTAGYIKGKSEAIVANAASPYASIIQYNPEQWEDINSIPWVDTGFCGFLRSVAECDAVFGGDIFISRHSLKRKLPFFRSNAHGLAPMIPFKHSDYFNINPPDPTLPSSSIGDRFFLDYEINDAGANFTSMFLFPGSKSYYNLDSGGQSIDDFYVKNPNKFYTYSYGIPHFLVESEINCNYRYAKREKKENFYPNIEDVIEFTQQSNVPIREPNLFFYNKVYSAYPTKTPYTTLSVNYQQEIQNKLNDLTNAIIYSQQDLSEASQREPWRNFKAADTFNFSTSYGKLIAVNPIESLQILVRFENGFTIYGSLDQLRDRLTPEVGNIGSGGIFAGRPVNFHTTQLGHAGTQNNAFVSSEFGHVWVDAKRGKVFMMDPNGQSLKEISKGQQTLNGSLEKWFKENLPFKIKRYFPNINIDNNFYGCGIAMLWDERFKRYIITKHDYIPLNGEIILEEDGLLYNTETVGQIITEYEQLGWTFIERIGSQLYFEKETEGVTCPCLTLTYTYNDIEYTTLVDVTGTQNGYNSFDFWLGEPGNIVGHIYVNDEGYWVLTQGDIEEPLAYETLPTTTCECVRVSFTYDGVEYVFDVPKVGEENGKNKYFQGFPNTTQIVVSWTEDNKWRCYIITQSVGIPAYYFNETDNECPFFDDWTFFTGDFELENLTTTACSSVETQNCPEGRWTLNESFCTCVKLIVTNGEESASYYLQATNEARNGKPVFTFIYNLNEIEVYFDSTKWIMKTGTGILFAYLESTSGCPFGEWLSESLTIVTEENDGKCSTLGSFQTVACADRPGEKDTLVVTLPRADFQDETLFKHCAWTVAYSPHLDAWISYYSYTPNYYIGFNDYFQSGMNQHNSTFGLWSHLPYLSSYQVFYGQKYPFIVEFPTQTQLVNSQMAAIEYWLDVRKYYNEHNFTDVFGHGFNKAIVYNSYQNTGLLHLIHQQNNNQRQSIEYPKHQTNYIEILQTEINGRWSFNYLYNAIKKEDAGLPIWIEDCAQIEKQLDNRLLEYRPVYKDYMRGDYFLVRLIQDAESRFKFLLRWITNSRDYYQD